jgi:hypothetical protein
MPIWKTFDCNETEKKALVPLSPLPPTHSLPSFQIWSKLPFYFAPVLFRFSFRFSSRSGIYYDLVPVGTIFDGTPSRQQRPTTNSFSSRRSSSNGPFCLCHIWRGLVEWSFSSLSIRSQGFELSFLSPLVFYSLPQIFFVPFNRIVSKVEAL